MKLIYPIILAGLTVLLAACSGENATQAKVATQAQASNQTVTAKVNQRQFVLAITPTQALQPGVARQYGIAQRNDTLFVLVGVTDASGNPVDLGSALVKVSIGIAPAAPTEVSMRPQKIEGYTNLVGVVTAKPPVKLQVRLDVQDGGAKISQSFTQDVLPR